MSEDNNSNIRRLGDLDPNAAASLVAAVSEEAAASAAKKRKTDNNTETTRIMTFRLSHSPVQVQALSSQSLYNLMDIICKETTVGQNERVYDHLWNVSVPDRGVYEGGPCFPEHEPFRCTEPEFHRASEAKLGDLTLSPGTSMKWEYDYGAQRSYTVTLVGEEPLAEAGGAEPEAFPRRKPVAAPTGYAEYEAPENIKVDEMFPTLNNWAFVGAEGMNLALFQAGRKRFSHGFMERENDGVGHMMYLPCKVDGGDLANYLHCFDYAARFKYATDPEYGHPCYSWYSFTVLPLSQARNAKLIQKFNERPQPGFVEMEFATKLRDTPCLNRAFPKVAALAGFRFDARVKKGWITYQNKVLRLCSGTAAAAEKYKRAPKGTAYEGAGQHEPASANDVLFEMQVEIRSLHHLLCVAEGLLRTL